MEDQIKKKIIYIVSAFPCYSEAFILREMLELRRRGIPIDIFSLRRLREPILQKDVLGFLPQTHYLPFIFSFKVWLDNLYWLINSPLTYMRCLCNVVSAYIKEPEMLMKSLAVFPKSVSFAKKAKDIGSSHIHAHFATYPVSAALIIHRLTGIPFTFSCHAHDIFFTTSFLKPKFFEAKKVFTVSEYNRKYIFGLFPEMENSHLEILRSPVDCQKFFYREPKVRQENFVILSVGRLANMKGFQFLIEACAILKKEGLRFSCRIIGGGPLKKELESLIKEKGLEVEVRLLGPVTEECLLEEYGNASVLVLACVPTRDKDRQDGLPAVLVEAMAIGIPVVSTSISGIPELVINDETGILIPPGDVKAIAESVKALYKDSDMRIRLAKAGRKKIEENFDIRNNVDRLMQVFLIT